MKFTKMAMGLILGVFLVGATYFISGSRQEKLQANVYTKANNGNFLGLVKACPSQVADVDADEADYTLEVGWLHNFRDVKGGWLYELKRKDGATLEREELVGGNLKTDPDAARVARQVCRDIQRDFPLWLNTQRVRASIVKSAQMGAPTSVDDDPPRRYEMMEYRNGPIVGQALLDTKLGRMWTLTNIANSAGKTERTQFKEISVENLWESEDEAYDRIDRAHSDDERGLWVRAEDTLSRLKKLTRPAEMRRAETEAEKER